MKKAPYKPFPPGTIRGPYPIHWGNDPSGGVQYMIQGHNGWIPISRSKKDFIEAKDSANEIAREILTEKQSPVATEVLRTGEAHFSQTGEFLHYPVLQCEGEIRQELAQTLLTYAKERMTCVGLWQIIKDWKVVVGTDTGDDEEENRYYYVTWSNPEKTEVSLIGILIHKGKPVTDHGLQIQTD